MLPDCMECSLSGVEGSEVDRSSGEVETRWRKFTYEEIIARDQTFDELYPLYSEYLQYAKVLMPDNQALEALGVVVR